MGRPYIENIILIIGIMTKFSKKKRTHFDYVSLTS